MGCCRWRRWTSSARPRRWPRGSRCPAASGAAGWPGCAKASSARTSAGGCDASWTTWPKLPRVASADSRRQASQKPNESDRVGQEVVNGGCYLGWHIVPPGDPEHYAPHTARSQVLSNSEHIEIGGIVAGYHQAAQPEPLDNRPQRRPLVATANGAQLDRSPPLANVYVPPRGTEHALQQPCPGDFRILRPPIVDRSGQALIFDLDAWRRWDTREESSDGGANGCQRVVHRCGIGSGLQPFKAVVPDHQDLIPAAAQDPPRIVRRSTGDDGDHRQTAPQRLQGSGGAGNQPGLARDRDDRCE